MANEDIIEKIKTMVNNSTSISIDNVNYGGCTASIATSETVGMVKPDGVTTTVDEEGTISANIPEINIDSGSISVATTETAGIVKPDGVTITIDNNGVISAAGNKKFRKILSSTIILNDSERSKDIILDYVAEDENLTVINQNEELINVSITNNILHIEATSNAIASTTTYIVVSCPETNDYYAMDYKIAVVLDFIPIVQWSDGEETNIEKMVLAAQLGEIDLHNYWAVGDIRKFVILKVQEDWIIPKPDYEINYKGAVYKCDLILMHPEGYVTDTSDRAYRYKGLGDSRISSFIVGTKDGLDQFYNGRSYLNLRYVAWENRNEVHYYKDSYIREALNYIYNAFPQWLKNIIVTSSVPIENPSTIGYLKDKLFLLNEYEIIGEWIEANDYDFSNKPQLEWYTITSNRIKDRGGWLTRSLSKSDNLNVVVIRSDGTSMSGGQGDLSMIALHFCI